MSNAADQPREFYQRYVEDHVPYHRSPQGLKRIILSVLPYWSYREWRFWKRWVPRGSRILDLGCARGREIFQEHGDFVVGMDLAPNALGDCVAHYDGAIEASLINLPAADGSFDCVVTSHVLGHVPVPQKNEVLAEIHRVLRPGGLTLHVIETDSSCRLMELAKQSPALYQRHLIEEDGHVGLETATEVVARFERKGFEVEAIHVLADADLHPRLAVKWFANGYRDVSLELANLVSRSEAVLGNPLRLAGQEVRLGLRGLRAPDPARIDEALFVAVALRKRR
jgi:SAM-dependent methyltransferase